jgi:ribosomal protein S18 acetylase RimI-like enzyme
MKIRHAIEADVPAIARVHVASWRAAYRGILPDHVLQGFSEEEREEHRRRDLGIPEHAVWVAEEDEVVVGFAMDGPARDFDTDPSVTGEVYAIYLDPDSVGRGIGRRLFAHAVGDLKGRGFADAILWVLRANDRGRRFYEAAGWRSDGAEKIDRWMGADFDEIRYRRDLGPAGD